MIDTLRKIQRSDATPYLWEKEVLTLYEAYLYSGIGTNKLRELTQRPDCPFLIWYGRTRLIDRAELEKYVKSVNRL